jgi:GMP synthase (glutamine-hydrolysing)
VILIVKHIGIEGPGTLGDFFKAKGEVLRTVELGAGDALPDDPTLFKAVVVLGGPMNVDQEARYPFLKAENEFIGKVLKTGVPYLGICLGAQLLAKAAGATVVQSPAKEIGWYHITLTQEGEKDPLFKGFCTQDPVYQWHEDMFQIPRGGLLLATNDSTRHEGTTGEGCPHQAFKVGLHAYGLQFHIEVTDKSIKAWCDAYGRWEGPGGADHARSMIEEYGKLKPVFEKQAQRLYQNFLEIIHVKNSPGPN